MGKSENKHCSVVSWADEVEKEEEEARAQLVHQKQTPNPFGSARPREVVLQERGIDWRKLDQRLHQPSRTSFGTQKEKTLKENVPAPAEEVFVKKENQVIFPSRRSPETNIGLYIPSSSYNLMSGTFVPQLNHPPTIIPTSLSTATRGSSNLYKREKMFREPGMDQFHRWNRMELDMRSGGHIDQQKIGMCEESNYPSFFGSSGREHERVRGQSMKAPNLVPKSTRENQQSHGKRKSMNCGLDLVGMPPETHRRGLRDKRRPLADEREMKNIHSSNGQRKRGNHDSGEEGRVLGGSEEAIVDGDRAEASHCINSKRASSAVKHDKKGLTPGSGNSHYRQKRR